MNDVLGAGLSPAAPAMTVLRSYTVSDDLTGRIMSALYAFFGLQGHSPSRDMYLALEDGASIIDRMAQGTCPAKYYVSSLDPGVGKTQTMIRALQVLTSDPQYAEVGAVVFVFRLEEIDTLVRDSALPPTKFAVLSSKAEHGSLGTGNPQTAQVLFTTQTRLENHLRVSRTFSGIAAYHFQGQPRQVRIWDESMVPGKPLSLSPGDVHGVISAIDQSFPSLAFDLTELILTIREAGHGKVMILPDFAVTHGVGIEELKPLLRSDHHRNSAADLWLLSGRAVSVRWDGNGRAVIDYEDILPPDLAPMLILDASARIRPTYRFWEGQDNLVRLRAAPKSYRNLEIKLWPKSGSKRMWKAEGSLLIKAVVSAVNTKPNEDWLIIHHKPESVGGRNIPEEVKKAFKGDPSRLKFITWGSHKSTNDYKDVSNVVLAGLLYMPLATYEALGRASKGLHAEDGPLPVDDFKAIRQGEFKHDVFQALCRAAVRGLNGDVCKPCEAYVIADARTGIPDALSEIFPDCHVQRWEPFEIPLRGKAKAALDYVVQSLSDEPSRMVPYVEVAKAVGMDHRNFKKDIRSKTSFKEALDLKGVAGVSGERGKSGFRMVTI